MHTLPTVTPPATPKPSHNGRAKDVKFVEYDQFIEKQIHRTRQAVKLVDFAYASLQLVVGVVVGLLIATLIEHWVVPGGLNAVARFLLFGLFVGSAGYFFVKRLWPLLRSRINPVYAAHTIERGHPTLKNSLVNFLLFRTRRDQMPSAVYQALEQQAAQGLARVPVEFAVDRTPLIRLGYVLVALVVFGAVYAFFSPKHQFATAGRVLAPWAAIAPPSRVHVDRVEPGTTTVTQGETLTVSAEIRGLREGETVRLRYTTADGQEVDAATAMQPAETGRRYEAVLPTATSQSLGLDEDLVYRIEAGDARTIDYKVTVVTAPVIVVRQVQYEYPDYTGYLDHKVENLGDIRGIEGTRVTIHAQANGPIDSAELDFDSDGRSDLRMKPEGTSATASFVLALREDRTPLHNNYTLRFENQDGHRNIRPAQYQIDVVPDYAPEVDLTAPEERDRDVQLNETVVVGVDARDPDFGVYEVSLVGQSTGGEVFNAPLLEPKESQDLRFTGEFRFTPSEHDLKPGDEVEYWATASDTRQPDANVTVSSRQTFRIVDPQPKQPDPNAIAQRDPPKNQEQQPGEQQPGQDGEGGAQQQPGNPGGQQGGEGVSQPGDAGEGEPGENGEQGENSDAGEGNQGGARGESNDDPSQGENGENSPGGLDGKSSQRSAKPGESGEQQPGESQEGDNQQGQSGENSTGEGERQPQQGEQPGEQQQKPVANDGTDDGAAFEQIAEHLNQQGQTGESGKPGEGEAKAESGERKADEAQSAEPSEPQPKDNQPGAQSEGQSKPNEEQGEPGKPDGSKPDDGERPGDEQPEGRADQQRPDASEGPGAKTQSGSPDPQEAKQQAEEGQTKSSGGEQQRPRGDAGQGAEEKPQGAPDGDQQVQERQKKPGDPGEKPSGDDTEPPAGSNNKKESDSQGEQGGDKTGGGKEGGGQKAPRDGTGSDGQNQAANDGAGRSADQGPGEDSTQPGTDAESQQPTGEAGEKAPGEGSGSREGMGDQPGGAEGAEPPGGEGAQPPIDDPVSRDAESAEPSEQPGADAEQQQPPQNPDSEQPGKQGGATGNPKSGGETGSEAQAASGGREAEDGDEANLEYARRQTDLALEKLSDQLGKQEVDQEMLDKLGWSEEDLKRFVDRWQERQAATKRDDQQGEAARQDLDQALKSLGLRPRELNRQTDRQQDNLRDLRDGPRAPVPIEWQEWMRAYNQGVTQEKP